MWEASEGEGRQGKGKWYEEWEKGKDRAEQKEKERQERLASPQKEDRNDG